MLVDRFTSDVIFFSSMRARAVAANSWAEMVFGSTSHAVGGGEVEDVFAAVLEEAAEIAIA